MKRGEKVRFARHFINTIPAASVNATSPIFHSTSLQIRRSKLKQSQHKLTPFFRSFECLLRVHPPSHVEFKHFTIPFLSTLFMFLQYITLRKANKQTKLPPKNPLGRFRTFILFSECSIPRVQANLQEALTRFSQFYILFV